jgi:uncharacterized membrane-anchored protein YjiN (DUF445 family)
LKQNKSFLTNFIAALLVVGGIFSPWQGEVILSMGLFALSGAITNWLAVHMLFEKVPGLYGSGVIPSRFEEFKKGIRSLIMGQFFTKENIKQFIDQGNESLPPINMEKAIDSIDFKNIFNGFVEVVQESSFGPMLAFAGGVQALEPMREPFGHKMRATVLEISQSEAFLSSLEIETGPEGMEGELQQKIQDIVEKRLDELTPKMVKEIIQEMIREHLGWLVVWGGVFGGLIGLAMAIIKS